MALLGTLASLSQTATANVADGSVDAPSTIDQQINLLASYSAQLRDGNGFATGLTNLGQCQLTKSGSNLLLSRFNGIGLTINNVAYAIPSAGVTLAPTSLTVGTTYYIYAYMNSGTMTLEAVTTAPAIDSTSGMKIKTADASRTLVGMARPITGPAWADTTAQRFVVSWFNRRPIYLNAVLAAGTGNAGASYSIVAPQLLLEFLCWGTDAIQARFQGFFSNNVANAVSATSIFLDGSASESVSASGAYTASAFQPVYCSLDTIATEGYHSFQIYANQDRVSTATYGGSGAPGNRCVHSGVIQG